MDTSQLKIIIEEIKKKLTQEINLEAFLEKIGAKVKDDFIPVIRDFFKNLFTSSNVNVVEVEMLTSETIFKVTRENIVEGSNEVVIFKEIKDDTFYVWATYSKDREFLPEDSNRYIVFKADGLSKDVKQLFEESDLVILK